MKDIVLFRGVRKDVVNFSQMLSKMDFQDQLYGREILNFNQYTKEFDYFISNSLGENLITTKTSGLFRKPYENIHFESFDERSKYLFMLMYEDNIFTTYKHKDTGIDTVFGVEGDISEFISDNCNDSSKWVESGILKLQAGDGICFRPWIWHSLQGNLVQAYYIIENVDIKEDQNDDNSNKL